MSDEEKQSAKTPGKAPSRLQSREEMRMRRRKSIKSLKEHLDKWEAASKDDPAAAKLHQLMKDHHEQDHSVEHDCAEVLIPVLDSLGWGLLMGFLIVVALFAYDFNVCFLPTTVDEATTIVLIFCGVMFGLELVINSLLRKNYLCSFFFWLDLVGTLSLIPDIMELRANSNFEMSELAVTKAGKSARIARTAGSVRITKFARLFRIIRLVRVVRLFRYFQSQKKKAADVAGLLSMRGMKKTVDPRQSVAKANPVKPSRIGVLLSDLITKRIILIVITLIIAIPLLEYPEDPVLRSQELSYGLGILELTAGNATRHSVAIDRYKMSMKKVAYLRVDNVTVVDNLDSTSANLRTNEMEIACYPLCNTEESDVGRIDLYNNIVISDIKERIAGQALYSMLMVIFVVFIFVFGSVIVSQDAHDLVVRPIERMTAVIRKLAGTICILSADEDEDVDLDQAEDGIDETILLESVVTKMAGIFNISGSNSSNKALGMLTGEKHTEFKTKSSVYSIHVVEEAHFERHSDNNVRLGAIAEVAASSPNPNFKGRELNSRELTPIKEEGTSGISMEPQSYNELSDLRVLLSDPLASKALRKFMAEKLNMESILFYQETERFRKQTHAAMQKIWENYIRENAINQININHRLRTEIMDKHAEESAPVNVFDKAQEEIFKLMETNVYLPFLKSQQCRQYIIKRYELRKEKSAPERSEDAEQHGEDDV